MGCFLCMNWKYLRFQAVSAQAMAISRMPLLDSRVRGNDGGGFWRKIGQ